LFKDLQRPVCHDFISACHWLPSAAAKRPSAAVPVHYIGWGGAYARHTLKRNVTDRPNCPAPRDAQEQWLIMSLETKTSSDENPVDAVCAGFPVAWTAHVSPGAGVQSSQSGR